MILTSTSANRFSRYLSLPRSSSLYRFPVLFNFRRDRSFQPPLHSSSRDLIRSTELIRLIKRLDLRRKLIPQITKDQLLQLIAKVDTKERPSSENILHLFHSFKYLLQSNPPRELFDLLANYVLHTRDQIPAQDLKTIVDLVITKEILLPSNQFYPSALLLSSNLSKHILRRLEFTKSEKLYLPSTCGSSSRAKEVLDAETYAWLILRLNPFLEIPEVNQLFHSLNRIVCLDFTCYKIHQEAGATGAEAVPFLCPCGNLNIIQSNKVPPLAHHPTLTEAFSALNSLQSQNKKLKSILRKLASLVAADPLSDRKETKIVSVKSLVHEMRSEFSQFPSFSSDADYFQRLLSYPELIEKSEGDFTPSLLCQSLSVLRFIPHTHPTEENTSLIRKILKSCYYRYAHQKSYFQYHESTTLPSCLLSVEYLRQDSQLSPVAPPATVSPSPYSNLTCDEVVDAILGFQELECNHHLIHHFLSIFSDYLIELYQQNRILSSKQIVTLCRGIQSMDSKRLEVNNLLIILSEHILKRRETSSLEQFTPEDVSLALNFLQKMSSDSTSFRKILSTFATVISEMNESLTFNELQLQRSLHGLKNSQCHFPAVQSLISEINKRFLFHVPPSNPSSSSRSLYHKDDLYEIFQCLTPFHSSTPSVRSLIDTLRLKLQNHSIESYSSKKIWICVNSLKVMSSDYLEVRMLLTFLANEIRNLPSSSFPSSSLSSSSHDINFIHLLASFHSLDSEQSAVRDFVSSLLSHTHVKSSKVMMPLPSTVGVQTLSNAVYGIQRFHGNFPEHDELMGLLFPFIESKYSILPTPTNSQQRQKLCLNHPELKSYSKILYGMIAQPSSSFHFSGNALEIIQILINFLSHVELPCDESLWRKASELNGQKPSKELLEDVGTYVNSYGSLIRSLLLFSFYSSRSQQLPSTLLSNLQQLSDQYLSIFDTHYALFDDLQSQYKKAFERVSWRNHEFVYSNLQPNSILPGQTDILSDMEIELSQSLAKVIQSRYPDSQMVTGKYLDGFQTDVLFKIRISADHAKELNLRVRETACISSSHLKLFDEESDVDNSSNVFFINFEIDGPTHQIGTKQRFCLRRDEYLTGKYPLLQIQRVNLLDYNLLDLKEKQFLYNSIAQIEWKKFWKRLKSAPCSSPSTSSPSSPSLS
jgi:hypothetical protein